MPAATPPPATPTLNVAVVGAGWAGLTAAVRARAAGHQVTLFEAARTPGGRARGVTLHPPADQPLRLDNGQHILIGAYTETLRLLGELGVDADAALLRLPLTLRFADGAGLALPRLAAPWDALVGIARARGWSLRERLALLTRATRWRLAGFVCPAGHSVADLCAGLPARLRREFIDPLCVAALNTPSDVASGAVFLRVLRDGLFGAPGGSNLLLPRTSLHELLPGPALDWLARAGASVRLGTRVPALGWRGGHGWSIDGHDYQHVIWATAAPNAVQALQASAQAAPEAVASSLRAWCARATALRHKPISTVYARVAPHADAPSPTPLLAQPMLALAPLVTPAGEDGAQFVFDHDALTQPARPTRLLAFVVSDSHGERAALQAAVVQQAREQLRLRVLPLATLTEKRATFVCSTALVRPPAAIAPGLVAAGDYVDGPYPATLEGAVRSGAAAAAALPAVAAAATAATAATAAAG